MRNIKEILRLHFVGQLSIRQISGSVPGASVGGVQKLLAKTRAAGLTWPLPDDLDDHQLSQMLYPAPEARQSVRYQVPVWVEVHQELKRKGMTKQLLWEEYCQHNPGRYYGYSQFCERYKQWLKKQKRSMRQTHRAGEKLFVDYAGQTVPYVSPSTGEVHYAQVFVAVLGASNYTYAEATRTQTLPDWVGSHVRAFAFFGGVSQVIVPDNLKSGVSKACRYDPELNPCYAQMAAHYGTVVIPARPRKPQDKAKAEVGVQVIERWILARLRHHTFFSLAEVNICIKALLKEVNNKPFKQLKGTRLSWFESLDKPALQPLPRLAYRYTDIKQVKVNIDYHIQYSDHLYSVPHHLVGEKLELHASDNLIELYFHNKRVASHVRAYSSGMTTVPEHMPVKHEKHHKWSPGRLMNWAKGIGDDVLVWVKAILDGKAHHEQAYRVCLGVLNLAREYPHERVNHACRIANHHKLYRYKHIKDILKTNQDKLPTSTVCSTEYIPQDHANIRGPESFY